MAKHGQKKNAKTPETPDFAAEAPAPTPKDALRPPRRRRSGKDVVSVAGVVIDVFGRRFTLEADGARTLVDLGRRGAALTNVAVGDRLLIVGQRKNGEVKAWSLRDEAERRAVLLRKEKRMNDERMNKFGLEPDDVASGPAEA